MRLIEIILEGFKSHGKRTVLTDLDACFTAISGPNGSGKSNVLAAIAQRDVPLPAHVDVFHLHEEVGRYREM